MADYKEYIGVYNFSKKTKTVEELFSRDEKTDLRTRKVNGKVVAKIKFTKFA